MFFTKHNFIQTRDENNNILYLTDISSVFSLPYYLRNGKNCDPFMVSDGDTPESIASTLYDDQKLSWVILMANGIKNVHNEWPMTSEAFNKMLEIKYGSYISLFLKLDSIVNYDIKKGDIVTSSSNTSGEVIDWNASLSKLTIKPLTGRFVQNLSLRIKNEKYVGEIGRINLYEQQSLHHFEQDGYWLDPLLGYLQSYIAGTSVNVVTNYDYELKLNDNKRNIVVPHKNYAIQMYNDYARLIT